MFSWFGPEIAMQAMLSISQTYENTANHKKTNAQRAFSRLVRSG